MGIAGMTGLTCDNYLPKGEQKILLPKDAPEVGVSIAHQCLDFLSPITPNIVLGTTRKTYLKSVYHVLTSSQ